MLWLTYLIPGADDVILSNNKQGTAKDRMNIGKDCRQWLLWNSIIFMIDIIKHVQPEQLLI